MLLFDVCLVPTKEEIFDGLKRSGLRRASKSRLAAQSIALLIVAGWSLCAYFGGDRQEPMSLFIAIAAVCLIPVMFGVPLLKMKSIAEEAAESGNATHMWVFDDGVDFGETQPTNAYYPYTSFYCDQPKDNATHQTLVFRFNNDEVVIVPKALLSEEQWQILCEKTKESQAAFSRYRA